MGQMCVPSREGYSRRFNVYKSCFRPFLSLILSVAQPFLATCLSLFATYPASTLLIVARRRRPNHAALVLTLSSFSAVPSLRAWRSDPSSSAQPTASRCLSVTESTSRSSVSELEHRSTFDEDVFYFLQM